MFNMKTCNLQFCRSLQPLVLLGLQLLTCFQTEQGKLLVSFTKLNFIMFVVRCFFLLSLFQQKTTISCSKHKPSFNCAITYGISQKYISSISLFILFLYQFVSDDFRCCLSELMILLSIQSVTKHLAYRNKLGHNLSYDLILKVQSCKLRRH